MRDIALVVLGLSIPLLTWSAFDFLQVAMSFESGRREYVSAGAVLAGSIVLAGTCYRIVRTRLAPNPYVLLAMGVLIWVALLA